MCQCILAVQRSWTLPIAIPFPHSLYLQNRAFFVGCVVVFVGQGALRGI